MSHGAGPHLDAALRSSRASGGPRNPVPYVLLVGVVGVLSAVCAVGLAGPPADRGPVEPDRPGPRSGMVTRGPLAARTAEALPALGRASASPVPTAADRQLAGGVAPRAADSALGRGRAAAITERLLRRQAGAVEKAEWRAFRATLDPAAGPELLRSARRSFDNLVRLGARDVRFGAPIPVGAERGTRQRPGGSTWETRSDLSFRMAGEDHGRWSATLRQLIVERSGHWYLSPARQPAERLPRPLWWQNRVEVVRGRHSLVIGAGPTSRLRAYAALADRAVPRVVRVWGRNWSRFVVVVVPASRREMERILGAEPDAEEQVASVTTSVGRSRSGSAPYVVVNPQSFATIGKVGRLVVLTHETTHVASRATTTLAPVWLSEGFADYVGFLRSGLPPRVVAEQLISSTRRSGPPARLPSQSAFDSRAEHLELAYESAWSACRYIAHTWGQDALVRFYRAMDKAVSAADKGRAYRHVLGTTPGGFVAGWRYFVAHLRMELDRGT